MHTASLILLVASLFASVRSEGTIHNIKVGPDEEFHPMVVAADKGDVLVFHLGKNMTVLRGDFDLPCQPLANTYFFSGDQIKAHAGDLSFAVNVTDNMPWIWYCTLHCNKGMVGGRVPPGDESKGEQRIREYQKVARKALENFGPPAGTLNARGSHFTSEVQTADIDSDSDSDTESSSSDDESSVWEGKKTTPPSTFPTEISGKGPVHVTWHTEVPVQTWPAPQSKEA